MSPIHRKWHTDLLFPANFLARFNSNPQRKHWEAVKLILRYAKETRGHELQHTSSTLKLDVYPDADWGNDPTRLSTSGGLITLAGGPVIFYSRKQTCVALSSTEAEFLAAAEAIRETLWTTKLLDELKIQIDKPRLFIDNQSTIRMLESMENLRRSKHIDIKYHFAKNICVKRQVIPTYIASEHQVADMLTKTMSGNKSKQLACKGGMKVSSPMTNYRVGHNNA